MHLLTTIIITVTICCLHDSSKAEPLVTVQQRYPDELKFYSTVLISMKKSCDSKRKTVCSGVLISKKYVLTAAKCVARFPRGCLEVTIDAPSSAIKGLKLFDWRRKIFDITSNVSYGEWYGRHAHTNIVRHPQTDISVVELSTSDTGSKRADVSYDLNDQKPGTRVHAIGWGYTRKTLQPVKPTLATLTILSKQECERMRLEDGTRFRVPDGLLCAVNTLHGTLAVEGDFGGPLLNKDLKVMGILIGRSPMPKTTSTPADPINLILPLAEFADFVREATIDNDLTTSYISYKVNVVTI